MRPLKLTLSAFGNYAKEQTIDFSRLNGKNLFLITGNTGAGKTTIFDAISYALYGSPSGEFRDTASLRSHYVDGDVETFVELEFQLRNKGYRIRRSPEQMLNKKRGEGYKKEGAKVELMFLDSDEKPLTKVKEVDDRINELLGVDKDQFRQIVMLPQGEFLKLLKANSKDREEIFRRIFGTEGFKKIQDDLRDDVKKLWVELKDSKNERDLYVKQIKSDEDSELYELINREDIDIEQVCNLVVEGIKKDKEDVIKSKENSNLLRNQLKELDGKILGLANDKKVLEEYESTKKRLEEHKGKIETVKTYEEKLLKGKKAEKIKLIENRLNEEKDNKTKRENTISNIRREKDDVSTNLEKAKKNLEESKSKVKEKEELIIKLEKLKKQEHAVSTYIDKKDKVINLEKLLGEKEKGLKSSKNREVELEKEIKDNLEELRKSIEAEGQIALILEKGKKHKRDIDALRDLKECYENIRYKKMDFDEKKDKFTLVEKNFKKVKLEFEKSEDDFKKGQAGILAESLEEGMSCPVCGSKEHPNKAVRPSNVLSEEEIKVLKENYDKAYEEKELLLRELTVLNKEIESFQKEVIGVKVKALEEILEKDFLSTLNESEQREKITSEGLKLNKIIEEERAIYRDIKKISDLKPKLEEVKLALEGKLKITKETVEECNEFIKINGPKLSKEIEVLRTIEAEVPESLRDGISIKNEMKKIELAIKEIEENIITSENAFNNINNKYTELNKSEKIHEEELLKINEKLHVIREEFEVAIKENDFKSYEDYKVSLISGDLELIDNKIKSYYENLKALEALYENINNSFNKLEVKDKNDLEELRNKIGEEYKEIELKEKNENNKCNLLCNRVDHNEAMLKKVNLIRNKIGEREKVYERLSHLSNIANGDKGNLKKITFESYVLTSYFDEIIERANIKLDKMTNGRFVLKRKEDLGKGNKKQGLDLEVYDNNTGKERGVNSLSGGESFKTALSLALGLADVIQSYAGGISIDTMFVDEGFGTLDPQSLDSAIECLLNIQQEGRLVGIISHVDELKERIEVKLEVKAKDGKGSTAKFNIPIYDNVI